MGKTTRRDGTGGWQELQVGLAQPGGLTPVYAPQPAVVLEASEPVLEALLATVRASAPFQRRLDEHELASWREEQAVLAAMWSGMPHDVRALVHTARTHQGSPDLTIGTAGFEWDLTSLHDHGDGEAMADVLTRHGADPTRAVVLGASPGGEAYLLLCWDAESLAFGSWDSEYDRWTAIGDARDLAVWLFRHDRGEERSTALQAVFVAAGLVEPAPTPPSDEAAWREVPPWAGPPQWPPVDVTAEEEGFLDKTSGRLARMRTADGALLGFNGPNVVVVRSGEALTMPGRRGAFSLAPSGSRFVVAPSRGAAVEYALDGSAPPHVVDGSVGARGAPCYRWGFDYYQDDDHAVTVVTGTDGKGWLLYLVRDPSTGAFEELHSVKVPTTSDVATTGDLIVVDGKSKSTLFTVSPQEQLVKVAAVARPPAGGLRPYPAEQRAEVRMQGPQTEYRLEMPKTMPTAQQPKGLPKGSQRLRRRAAGPPPAAATPQGWNDEADMTFLLAHPAERRAMGWDGARKVCFEQDLDSGARVDLLAGVVARYCFVGDRELLLAVTPDAAKVFERSSNSGDVVLLGTHPYPLHSARPAGGSFLVRAGKDIRRVQVVAAGDSIGFEVGGKLVGPERFSLAVFQGARHNGRDHLVAEGEWFPLDP